MRGQTLKKPRRFGDYELLRLLGSGGMAEVFEARRWGPHGFNKRLAVKRLLPQLASDPRIVRMFCNEARIQASLSHPNLVQVVDFGEQDGELYMTMELVDGMTCADLLSAVAARARSVDLGPALHIAREVLRGLCHVHGARDESGQALGLVHRDVAPGNILIGRSGAVKLADFGIMVGAGIERCTAPGELKGKIGYISPEQSVGQSLGARCDVFSLGVVLAEMLIGRPLFDGRDEVEILTNLHASNLRQLSVHGRHIPTDVLDLLTLALASDPTHRPSAAELLAALEDARSQHQVTLGDHDLVEWMIGLGLLSVRSGIRCRVEPRADAPAFGTSGEAEVTLRPVAVCNVPTAAEVPQARPVPDPAGVVYRLHGNGTDASTPLSLADMLERIATGRVLADAPVSRNDGPVLPLSSMIELARLAARGPYRGEAAHAASGAEREPIRPASIARTLFRLAHQRRSGLLLASDGAQQKRVYFVDGRPAFTASSDPKELLGARLVGYGLLSQGAMEAVLETGWRRGQRLGEAMVAAGRLRPADLRHALSRQRNARLRSLCRWSEGELWFFDEVAAGEEPLDGESALPVIARAVMETYSLDQLAWMMQGVRRARLYRTVATDSLSRALQLPGAESVVLERADQAVNVDLLVRALAVEGVAKPQTTLRAVLVGLTCGALLSDSWPPK